MFQHDPVLMVCVHVVCGRLHSGVLREWMLRLRGSNVTQEDIEQRRRYVRDMGREGRGETESGEGTDAEGRGDRGRREGRRGGRGGNCD